MRQIIINMLKNLLHFFKYNNAAIIILAIVLIIGGGALAAGPENIGQKQTSIQGLDNTALLTVDLKSFNMDFKIENIQQDEKYYYVTYSYLDLILIDSAWQYQLSQKTQKVSQKIKQDIGLYMAKFMAKHYEARMRELKQEKSLAQSQGEQKRVEVTAYSGLIGKTLDIAAAVFPGYEPVVKVELPAPVNFNLPETPLTPLAEGGQTADNLTRIYNNYVADHPEIFEILETPASEEEQDAASTAPESVATPDEPETPTITEPESVDIIELPAPAETPAPEPEAPAEPVSNPEPETPPQGPAPAETPAPEPAPAETPAP